MNTVFLTGEVVERVSMFDWFKEPIKAGATSTRLDVAIVCVLTGVVVYVLYKIYKNRAKIRRRFK